MENAIQTLLQDLASGGLKMDEVKQMDVGQIHLVLALRLIHCFDSEVEEDLLNLAQTIKQCN